jgi:hypothetical protein
MQCQLAVSISSCISLGGSPDILLYKRYFDRIIGIIEYKALPDKGALLFISGLIL